MSTDVVLNDLARWMFGLSASFHFLFVPLSIGLLLCINLLQTAYVLSRRPTLQQATQFWSRFFLLAWATGVATNTLLRRWVPAVPLMLLGWLLLLVMMVQSLTILSINAWMQVPQMLHLGRQGWQVPTLWPLLTHPTTLQKTWHTLSAALLCGAFFVFALSAALMRQGRERSVALVSVGAAAWVALLGALSVMFNGHESASGVAERQPLKFAAFEGHWRAEAEAAKPPVKAVFFFFSAMVLCGVVCCLLALLAFWLRKPLRDGELPSLMRLLAWAIYGNMPTALAGQVNSASSGVLGLLQLFAAGLLISLLFAWATWSVFKAGSAASPVSHRAGARLAPKRWAQRAGWALWRRLRAG